MSLAVRDRFWEYHRQHPQIYRAFEEKALVAARKKKRFGAKAIFEILRWETSVVGDGDEFKLRNEFTPYYARLFEHNHPEHKGFFRKKKILPTD